MRFWKCSADTSSFLFLQYYNKISKSFLILTGAIVLNCFTFLPKYMLKLSNIASKMF